MAVLTFSFSFFSSLLFRLASCSLCNVELSPHCNLGLESLGCKDM